MEIAPFALERYFAAHEFTARALLSCSDGEPLALAELLALADDECRGLWDGLRLGYTESLGHPLLRCEVAALYEGLSAPDVLTAAPQELIFLFMHAVLRPGDHVVCTSPAYQSLHEVARSIGCRVTCWEAEEGEGWAFAPDRLRRLLEPQTKLVVVNFPHNPTGALPAEDEYRSMVALAEERGAWILSDEMYRFLEHGGRSPLPAAATLSERAFSLAGLSKAFGLPGLRLGWVAGRARGPLRRLAELKDYTTICAGAPGEILGLIALRNRQGILAGQRARLARNLQVLRAFLERQRERITAHPPQGGTVCLARLERAGDSAAFCDRLRTATGIMLVPSSLFSFGHRHVRLGLGREDFPAVLAAFEELLIRQG